MSYGARIFNENGGVLIDSELPSMVADETGTLDSWRGQNDKNEWVFDLSRPTKYYGIPGGSEGPNPNPLLGSDENSSDQQQANTLLFVKLEVGVHFWYGGVTWGKTVDTAAFGVVSNAISLEYALVRPRSIMPAPSGYGMALFDRDGNCTWDSNHALGYIDGANQFLLEYSTMSHRANSLWVCIPPLPSAAYDPNHYSHNNSILAHPRVHRVSASEIKVQRIAQSNPQNSGGAAAPQIGTPVLTGRF